jgi:hypothetical protein
MAQMAQWLIRPWLFIRQAQRRVVTILIEESFVRMFKRHLLYTSLSCVFLLKIYKSDQGILVLADIFRCCLVVAVTKNIVLM